MITTLVESSLPEQFIFEYHHRCTICTFPRVYNKPFHPGMHAHQLALIRRTVRSCQLSNRNTHSTIPTVIGLHQVALSS
jgi:hypothetical protein